MPDPRSIHEFSSIESELESSTSLFLLDVETDDPDYTSGYKTGNATVAKIGEKVVHDTEYPLLIDTVDKSVTGGINENKAVIGYNYDAYDDATTYAAGDLCIYGNTLYKALQATTGNLPTNPTYWAATSIAGVINELSTGKQDKIPDTVAKNVTFDVTPSGGEVKAKVYNRVLYVSGYFRFSSNQSTNTQLLHISDVTLAMEVFESSFTDGSTTVRFKLTTDGKLINENQFQANQWVSISLACLLA